MLKHDCGRSKVARRHWLADRTHGLGLGWWIEENGHLALWSRQPHDRTTGRAIPNELTLNPNIGAQ